MSSNTPAPTRPYLTLLFVRQKQSSPLCIPVLPFQTLVTASTTLCHIYLFTNNNNNNNNAHVHLLLARHCSRSFSCIASVNLHNSLLRQYHHSPHFRRKWKQSGNFSSSHGTTCKGRAGIQSPGCLAPGSMLLVIACVCFPLDCRSLKLVPK